MPFNIKRATVVTKPAATNFFVMCFGFGGEMEALIKLMKTGFLLFESRIALNNDVATKTQRRKEYV